jgi:hypothetical protein
MAPLRSAPARLLRAAVILAALPVAVRAQALPDARSLMAKHDAAVGGRAAIDKFSSIHQTGTFAIAAMGLEAPVDIYKAKPNKYLMKVVLGPVGEVLQGSDGKTLWAIQPQMGAVILDGAQAEAMKVNADFFSGLHDAALYKSAETVELTDFDGRKCYKVKLVSASGAESYEFFDAATGLRAGAMQTVDTPMGKMEQTSVPSDYKEFNGIKFPTRIVSKNGQYDIAITMTSVEFDKVEAATFALPEAIKALVKP